MSMYVDWLATILVFGVAGLVWYVSRAYARDTGREKFWSGAYLLGAISAGICYISLYQYNTRLLYHTILLVYTIGFTLIFTEGILEEEGVVDVPSEFSSTKQRLRGES